MNVFIDPSLHVTVYSTACFTDLCVCVCVFSSDWVDRRGGASDRPPITSSADTRRKKTEIRV